MRLAYWASLLICISSLSAGGAVYQSATYTSGFANNGGASVTGIYQPDQRNSNPANTIDTSPRGPGLNAFNGLDSNRSWSLFFSDISDDGESQIQLPGFDITATPEPTTISLAIFGTIAGKRPFSQSVTPTQGRGAIDNFRNQKRSQ